MQRANSRMTKESGSGGKGGKGKGAEGSMKFHLPSSGVDEVKFQLSGFKEMASFKDPKILSRPPPSSMGNYTLNTRAGRTVPKFNIMDLPQDIDFDHDLFKAESYFEHDAKSLAALRTQAIASLKKDAGKPGGGIYGAVSKPSKVGNVKKESGGDVDYSLREGETVMSNTERIRQELMNFREVVRKDVAKDIGFGFRKPGQESIKAKKDALIEQETGIEPMMAKKMDKSVRALQAKIKQQRQHMKEMNVRNASRSRSRSPIRNVSIMSKEGSERLYRKEPVQLKTQEFVNEKLASISLHFRESLKESTRELMKSSGKPKKPSLDKITHNQPLLPETDLVPRRDTSILYSRSNTKFLPVISKDLKILDSNPKSFKPKASKSRMSEVEDDPSQLDYSGLVKLRSLLETNLPETLSKPVAPPSIQQETRRRTMEHPPVTLDQMKREGQGQSSILNRNRTSQDVRLPTPAQEERILAARKKSVAFATQVQISPRVEGVSGRGLYKSSVDQGDISGRLYPQIPSSLVRQKVGESVKTLDDASRVANALGGLMTRVAVARDINKPSYEAGGRASQSTTTGTMTEGPVLRPMHKIPDIKLDKDMSAADQRQLLELRQRSKTQNWGSVKISAD